MLVTTPTTLDGEIDDPAGTGQSTIYRQALELSLVTGGQADGVVIDLEKTLFAVQFEEKQYDLLKADSPFAQTYSIESVDGALVVECDRPLRIQRINLPAERFPKIEGVLLAIDSGWFDNKLIHTVKRKSLGAAATQYVNYQTHGDMVVAAKKDYSIGKLWEAAIHSIELYRMDGEVIADSPTSTAANKQTLEDEFIANRFAIKGYDSNGDEYPLHKSMLKNLWVKSAPTSPRIGWAKIDSESSENKPDAYFWRLSGEQLTTTEIPRGQAGELLGTALQMHLDVYFQNLVDQAKQDEQLPISPATIHLTMVLESDTPCAFKITQLEIPYGLIRQASSQIDGQGKLLSKEVLRFQGEHLQVQQIQLQLPQDATIKQAELKTAPSFTGDDARFSIPLPPPLKESDQQGLHIAADSWAAQRVCPDKAITLTGLLLGLLILQEETQLHIEICEDWNDGPNGSVLASVDISMSGTGRREWFRADFDNSIVLDSSLYWIVIRAAKGAALWLLGEPRGQVFRGYMGRGSGESPRVQAALEDKAGLYGYLSCCRKMEQLPFKVEIEGVEAGVSMQDDRSVVLDLTNGLTTPEMAVGLPESVDVEIITPLKGMLTAYPVRLEYELIKTE